MLKDYMKKRAFLGKKMAGMKNLSFMNANLAI